MRDGHAHEARAQAGGLFEERGQGLWPMEGEDRTRAWLWIALVAEEGLDAGRFVVEGERPCAGEKVGQVLAVVPGLLGHARERRADLLRLDDANGLAIDEK